MKRSQSKLELIGINHAFYSGLWRRVISLFLILSVLLLAACQGSDLNSDKDNSDEETGEVIIGLTDADGDFLGYTVNVKSLTLTRKDGTVVDTLPLATQVDFAQYTELTEFFTAQTVPAGRYVKGTMVLDYSNADIQVELNGGSVAATPLDQDGNKITGELEVEVKLDNLNAPLLVAPGIPAHITLDFDLETSNKVDIEATPVTVTVEPVLVADVELEKPKAHRVRGPLKSVNSENGTFKVMIRPFRHVISKQRDNPKKDFGVLTVTTTADTAYEIDGEVYVGREGITRLSELELPAPVVAFGEIKLNPRRFVASEVRGGSSVPGSDKDVLKGHVIARVGNVVTVRGATLIRDARSAIFHNDVTVTLGEDTKVVKQAYAAADLNISAISVGQHVSILGEVTDRVAGQLKMDATTGLVRMLLTDLRGTVNSATTDIDMELQSVDFRPVSIFNFAGTGRTSDLDADPAAYEVGTGSLNTSNYQENDPVIVRGHVQIFGQAPVDFEAKTLIDPGTRKAAMNIGWNPATTSPFKDISATRLILNLEGVGEAHHIKQAGVLIDLTELDGNLSVSIEANESGKGLFAIKERKSVQIYTTFESFSQGLGERLDDGKAVKILNAKGDYDSETATLVARKATVVMQ